MERCSNVHKSWGEVVLWNKPPKSGSLPELYKLDGSKVTDWSWTCPTKMSYWNKFHEFYLPNGSFSRKELNMSDGTIKFRNILYLSELYQKKYKALGIKVSDSGNGRKSCMARINLSTHRENKIVNILNNFLLDVLSASLNQAKEWFSSG